MVLYAMKSEVVRCESAKIKSREPRNKGTSRQRTIVLHKNSKERNFHFLFSDLGKRSKLLITSLN